MAIDPIKKSSRLLQSRRYTLDTLTDGQEAFTQVLDLGSSEIYSQTNLIPTSSLPFSGSSQSGATSGVLKFWYRQKLTRGIESDGRQVWFFLDPAVASADSQTIQTTQVTNFISPKYSIPSLAASSTEIATPGYLATVRTSSDGFTFSDAINTNNYAFDYKTGVLQFSSSAVTPASGDIYISTYQYIGRTLASDSTLGYSGSFSGSFQGNGSGLTNIPASGITGLNLTQIASSQVSASVSSTGTPFIVSSGSINLLTVSPQGLVSASLFSGSFVGTSNTTGSFVGIGSGSFSGSFSGNGAGLTDLPASSIVGLNLSQIATGSVSSTVSVGTTSFQVVSGSSTLMSLSNTGNLTVSGSETIGGSLTAKGNTIISGSLAVTGSAQYSNSVSITGSLFVLASSSLSNATVTGSLLVTENLTVLGTASFTSITSSQIIVGASTITLNTDAPAVRFGGINVVDSGSFGNYSSGSLLWDSVNNRWIYANPSGSTYDGGGLMSGPRNTSGRGNETYPTQYAVLRGQGADHLEDSSIYSTGSYVTINKAGTGSRGVEVDILGSVAITGSTLQTSPLSTAITSSEAAARYALVASQSAWFYNHNAGVPTSNAWQTSLNGSYFNNFDHNTNVSEILRFVAGLLSSSAPAPTPNTQYYGAVTEDPQNTGTGTVINGYVPQSSTNDTLNYLTSKGFATVGSTIFNGIGTIYNNASYFVRYDSNAAGTTTVSSSVDAQLFGLGALTSGGPTQFNVSGALFYKYEDNNSVSVTATSASQALISLASFGTSNGLTLAKINTANPAVIPAAYQDGKFVDILPAYLFAGSTTNIASRLASSVSSSGYYQITASIGIATGSQTTYVSDTKARRLFWAPLSTISSNIPDNSGTISSNGGGSTALTATSRSLSGAPYLTAATWNVSSSVTNLFNPLFGSSTTLAQQTVSGNITIVHPAVGSYTASVNSGVINTSNTIFDSTGVTARATSTTPFQTDIAKLTGSLSLSIGTGTNITSTGISPTTFSVLTYGRNRDGNLTSAVNTQTIFYHSASTFAQPGVSGTLAYYGQAQGYDGGSLTGTSETFSGETYRLQITDKLLSGSYAQGDKFTTGSYSTYSLSSKDLQVKPGYLVRPGGTYGYWLANDGTEFKYYARAFNSNNSNQINSFILGLTLSSGNVIKWNQTAVDGVACLVICSNSTGLNNAIDIKEDSLTTQTFTAGTNGTNPFGSNLTVYKNTATYPTVGIGGVFLLDGSNQNFVVLVRMRGDVGPVTNLSITYP